MLRHSLVFFAVTAVALAAVAIQPLEEKPEKYKHCEGCWVSEIQQLIPLDESRPNPKYCGEYRCTKEYVQIVSCGVAAVQPPCYVTRDMSKPYPKCCVKVVCPPTAGTAGANTTTTIAASE